ncbi:MAG: GHKL domain-containing protein [Bacteriovoracaceae bacterium]|jgi:C4-dicarboxylate-specific signal transduction histidine kinase|nr:GHKL domain-containing protein [Bacteriovoracaceae bacterium]
MKYKKIKKYLKLRDRIIDPSLRSKSTIVFLLASLVPILFFSFIVIEMAKIEIERNSLDSLKSISKLIVRKIESHFGERISDIRVASEYYNIKTNLPILGRNLRDKQSSSYIKAKTMLDNQLKTFVKSYKYHDLMLLDGEGQIVYTAQKLHQKHLGERLPENISSVFLEGRKGIYISQVVKNIHHHQMPQMYISAPVQGFNGLQIGVIVLEIDMSGTINMINDRTGLKDTGETLIGAREGEKAVFINPLRHDSAPSLGKSVKLGADYAFPTQEAVRGNSGSGKSFDYRAEETIAVWSYIPLLRWGVVAKIDQNEAYAPIGKLKSTLFIITLFTVILIIFLSRKISQIIFKPLQQLTGKALHISNNKVWSAEETKNLNEVKVLEKTFDFMTTNLLQMHNQLEEKNVKLSEKIIEVENTKQQLIYSSKMKALGVMAGGMAHEINNPITIIVTTSKVLRKNIEKGKLSKELVFSYLEKIDLTVLRITKIVNGLRVISRDEASEEYSDCSFKELLNDSLALCQEKFKIAGVDLILDWENPALDEKISCLRVQLSQVLINLLGNAYDAIENLDEKWVRLELTKKPVEGKMVIELRVIDSGNGISQELHDKIFNPFFTTKEVGKGTGIGLSISKSIIEKHGGGFCIDDRMSNTTFIVQIPISKTS